MPGENINFSVSIPGEQFFIALFGMVTALVESQPPEVKKQLWDWYVQDVKKWRKLFKLED